MIKEVLTLVLSKPAVADLKYFLLEQKEPKIQDKPDPSGRFVVHHTVMATMQMVL